MSDLYNDFEKVDPEPYQDENITSTSMTGDMAEEDRYPDGSSAQNDIDMFSSGGGSMTENTDPKPLISFGEPSVEPTAPPMESESSVSGAKPVDGNWMKNVDPRDNPLEENMADQSEAMAEEPSAKSDLGVNLLTGDDSLNKSETDKVESVVYKSEESTPDKELDSDSSDYSSSGEESDSEHSDTSDDGVDKHVTESKTELDQLVGNECFVDKVPTSLSENIVKSATSDDESDYCENKLKNSEMETFEGANVEVKMDENTGAGGQMTVATGVLETVINKDSNINQDPGGIETLDDTGASKDYVCDTDDKNDISNDNGNVMIESELPGVLSGEVDEIDSELNNSDKEKTDILEAVAFDDYPKPSIPDIDLSDVIDKLTNDDDIVDNISPVVSDYEKEIDTKENDMFRESSGSPEVMSEDSGSCSDNDSVDSDISGDEAVCGTWNPSPLYEFSREEDEDGDSQMLESEGTISNAGQNFYDFAGGTGVQGYPHGSVENENNINELREDVKGLMEEMETLVKQGQEDEHQFDDSDSDIDSHNIEVVGMSATTQSSFRHSDRSKAKLSSDSNDPDMLHVRFHSPTNTLFFDPESPIVEKVSEEVQQELIDYDDEAKDLENEKEVTSNVIVQAQLQAEVVKDLKDVYEKLEAYKESESAISEPADEPIKQVSAGQLNAISELPDPAKFNLYKSKVDRKVEPEEEEVLLRRKNNLNADANLHRSQRISDNASDSIIIHDLEQPVDSSVSEPKEETIEMDVSTNANLETVPESQSSTTESDDQSEMKSSTDSMIVHDEDEELTTVDAEQTNQTNEIETESVDKQTDIEPVNQAVNKLANELVEQIFKDADQIMEKMKTDSAPVNSSITVEGDISEDKVVKDIEEKDFDTYVCDSDEEVVEDVAPFDDSLNDTVIDTQNVDNEIDDQSAKDISEDAIKGEICENSVGDAITTHEKDELGDQIIPENVDQDHNTHNSTESETLEVKEVLLTPSKPAGNDKEPTTKKVTFMRQEMMAFVKEVYEQVLELIYWRDVKKTGVVFGSMMFILLSLSICSLMSVLAYLSLAILTVTLSFRVYKNVMQAVQKTNDGHPFKNLLDMDIALQEDVVKNAADKIAENINNCAKELRRLYLVEDYVDTLKFGLMLWLMTYIGAWFDGMTLVILGVISIFTLPKVYETYKVPIDQNVNLVRAQLNNIMAQVSAKLPFPKKKAKTQ